jgi:glutaredoxin
MRKIILVIFFLTIIFPIVGRAAGNPVELYFFEGQGCPHCARMTSYLEGLKADYPNLVVKNFEVYFNKDNQNLFAKMAAVYNSDSSSIPVIFIGDQVIRGEDYEGVKNAVDKCSTEVVCASPADKLGAADINSNTNVSVNTDGKNEVVGWVVIGAVVVFGALMIYLAIKRKK